MRLLIQARTWRLGLYLQQLDRSLFSVSWRDRSFLLKDLPSRALAPDAVWATTDGSVSCSSYLYRFCHSQMPKCQHLSSFLLTHDFGFYFLEWKDSDDLEFCWNNSLLRVKNTLKHWRHIFFSSSWGISLFVCLFMCLLRGTGVRFRMMRRKQTHRMSLALPCPWVYDSASAEMNLCMFWTGSRAVRWNIFQNSW